MEERRKFKNFSNINNQHNYKQLRNLIQRQVKIAKEQRLNDICQDVGEYIKRGWSDLAFTKIRKFFQEEGKRNNGTYALLSKDGKIFMETEQKVKR